MDTERELVQRVLAGERDALRDLIGQYERLVARIVFRIVRDEQDREEVCQDVFVRVYRKLGGFQFESKLSTWIARIAYRTCLNHLEKRRLPAQHDLAWTDDASPNDPTSHVVADVPPLDDAVATAEMRTFVRDQVNDLPVPFRTAVTLFYLEGMSVGEVGEVMALPAGTIKSHLFRARKVLRDKLLARYSMGELQT